MIAASAFLFYLGHEIVGLFRFHLEQVKVVGGAIDDLAGAARRLDGDIQGWMHGLKSLRVVQAAR